MEKDKPKSKKLLWVLLILLVVFVALFLYVFDNISPTSNVIFHEEEQADNQICHNEQVNWDREKCILGTEPLAGAFCYISTCTIYNQDEVGGDFLINIKMYDDFGREITNRWSDEPYKVYIDSFTSKTFEIPNIKCVIRGDSLPEIFDIQLIVNPPTKQICENNKN